ncbi:MAG: DUF4383 domain-containing protein [Solirubrobacterales bacterium]
MSHGSMTQMFARVAGVVLTLLGIAGLIVNADFSTGSAIVAERVLFFDVNGWSSVVHLVSGLVLLVAATRGGYVRTASIAIAGLYLVLAVWSLFDASILDALPVNDPTAILYAAVAVVGLAAVYGPDRSDASA